MVLSGLAAEIVQKKITGIPPLKAVVCPCLCMLLFGRVHGGAATGPKKIASIPPAKGCLVSLSLNALLAEYREVLQ